MPDKRLQAAMEEIKATLRKHDVAGLVILNSPTHLEFLYGLSPSWACTEIAPSGRLRIVANPEKYPDAAKREATVNNTIGMVTAMHTMLGQMAGNMQALLSQLGTRFDIFQSFRSEPTDRGDFKN